MRPGGASQVFLYFKRLMFFLESSEEVMINYFRNTVLTFLLGVQTNLAIP